jgi:pimeloyl-[acyl-carrier protein] methyl ester esterase
MDLHVEVAGCGPPLVLLHGWGLHGGVFAPLVERLAADFQLHLVDLPGHGHSRRCALPLELDECATQILGQTPAAPWIAWSLGGLFALRAAALSTQVQALALVAATPRFVRAADWPHAVEPEVFAQFARELEQDHGTTLQRFLALDTLGSDQARSELRTLKDTLYARGEPSPAALRQGLSLLQDSDLRASLPCLRIPSLWLSGRRDRLVPPAAMATAAAAAGGRHVDIPGGGHAPFLGHADEVAGQLRAFLADSALEGGTR